MKKIALILIITFTNSICYSDENKSAVIAPLKKGVAAPFNGILYNYEADAVIQEEIDSAEKICNVKNEYAIKIQQANCDSEKKEIATLSSASTETLKIQLDTCFKDVNVLNEAIKKPAPPIVVDDGSKHWWLLAGIGIGAALASGTFYLVKKLQ